MLNLFISPVRWDQLAEEVSLAAANQPVQDSGDNSETPPVQEDRDHIYEALDQTESETSGNLIYYLNVNPIP